MAHNIYRDAETGRDAMWCVGDRKSAWHELGQRTDSAQTWAEAIKLAGLDWDVEKVQLMGCPTALTSAQMVNAWGIFRKTDGAFFGAVGRDYGIIQNRYAGALLDTLLEVENGAHYESAGALGNGSRIWALARIPHDIRIKGTGDVHQMYILYTTAHDGTAAATVKLTAVRVVCQNTLNAALSRVGNVLRICHNGEATAKIEAARKAMTGITQDITALETKLNILAERRMTKDSMLAVIEELFPLPTGKEESAGVRAAVTRRENIVTQVLRLFESNDNNAIPEVRGSAYNLLNAVTEYIDHEKPLLGDDQAQARKARAAAAVFGAGERMKNEALDIIMRCTLANSSMGASTVFVPNSIN